MFSHPNNKKGLFLLFKWNFPCFCLHPFPLALSPTNTASLTRISLLLPSGSHAHWSTPSHGHCSQAAPNFHTPDLIFFGNMRCSRAPPLPGSSLCCHQCGPEGSWSALWCWRPSRYQVVGVTHNDQGLQKWGFFQMSVADLACFFLLSICSIAGTCPQQHPFVSDVPRCISTISCCSLV